MTMDALTKANRMLTSLWSKIEEKQREPARKLMKYKHWASVLDKKMANTLHIMKSMEHNIDLERKEKLLGKLSSLFRELLELLMVNAFRFDSNGGYSQEFIQNSMLDVWSALIVWMGRENGELLVVAHDVVLHLLKRGEFDIENLLKSDATLARYRDMLLATLSMAAARMSDGGAHALFAARVFAVLFWRIPELGELILTSVCVEAPMLDGVLATKEQKIVVGNLDINGEEEENGEDNLDIEEYSSIPLHSTDSKDTTNNNNDSNNNSNNTNNDNNDAESEEAPTVISYSSSASLFGWNALKADLPPPPLLPWLDTLARRELAFVFFFREWILYVKSVLNPFNDEWYHVPGFTRLLHTVLHDMRTRDQPPPPLFKPTPLLELQYMLLQMTRCQLIDAYVKAVFLRTSVFDIPCVFNTLSLIEGWLGELLRESILLPLSFDMDFFCRGLGILLNSDHHQVVIRVLQIVYSYSDLVDDPFRFVLFGDLLIKQFFFTLFLHWDPGVRNAYHQLLIFRMVRVKRSVLSKDGFMVRELARLNSPCPPPTENQSSFFSSLSSAFSFLVNNNGNSNSNSNNNNSNSNNNNNNIISSNNNTTNNTNTNTNTNTNNGNDTLPLSVELVSLSPKPSASSVMSVDVHLFLQLESYIHLVEDQLRLRLKGGQQIGAPHYPASLEVYAPGALAEYTQHLSRYYQWELRNEPPPKLMPIPFLRAGEGG